MTEALNWDSFDAALFDLDGVITPTAKVHMDAWAEMFTDYLSRVGAEPYTEQDYYDHLDGKPRYDGVQSLLESRGIELEHGSPDDPTDAETVCGLGNRKDEAFNKVLKEKGISAYPKSVELLDHLQQRGTGMAIVSSSKNATAVLRAAGLLDRFPIIVDGKVAGEQDLPGKPAPDTFLFAAKELGAPIERAVVFEDAISGVKAGAAGKFGAVVGVDRGAGVERLREAGADRVVKELDELIEKDKA